MHTGRLLLVLCLLGAGLAAGSGCGDPFAKDAFLTVRNGSTGYDITWVSWAHVGRGENRLSSPLSPGQEKRYTLDAKGDYIYDFTVESNHPQYPSCTGTEVHFYEGREVWVTLRDDSFDWDANL